MGVRNEGAIDALSGLQSSITDLVAINRQLLDRIPASPPKQAGFGLVSQLYLRRNQIDCLRAWIDDGKRYDQARTTLQNVSDGDSNVVVPLEIPKGLLAAG